MNHFRIIISKFFEFFTENWKVKLGSLFLAGIFYVNLQNSKILIKTFNIPIEYPKLEKGKYYSEDPPKTLPVRVEGLRELVNYYPQFMRAIPDFSDLNVGENTVPIKTITGIPSGIKVTKLQRTVTVYVEEQSTKQVPIEVVFEDELPANFEKVSYGVRPNRITLAGRQSDLDKINKITLPPISLKDITESFVKKMKIPELPRGLYVLGRVREITVNVIVTPQDLRAGEQIITGIPLQCVGLHPSLEPELSVEQVSLKIQARVPVKSSSIINGIQATVPCNHSYDSERKKIIPNDQPAVYKIRISRSSDLKNIEILQVIPDKVTVGYRVKADLKSNSKYEDEINPEDYMFPSGEDQENEKGSG